MRESVVKIAATHEDSMLDVAAQVAATGRRFVADIQRARKATADWTDEELGQALVDAALDRLLSTLAETEVWGRGNLGLSQDLWRIVGPVLQCGDLQYRARIKPRGYAGDYKMFEDFWHEHATAQSPGKLFDRYFLKTAAVEAARARMELAAASIIERCLVTRHEEYRVVNIGSGPAIDLYLAARALPREHRAKLRFMLVDIDAEALVSAQQRLAAVVDAQHITTVRENLSRLAKKSRGTCMVAESDFILCQGLFDYFTDDAASEMLALFWHGLRSGGTLTVGNFAPHCPTRAYMEWIANWHLNYRTNEDMARLAESAGIAPSHFRIVAERTGCDLFLVAEKPLD